MRRAANILAVVCTLCCGAQGVAVTPKTTGKLSQKAIHKVDSIMREGLRLGYYPGAAIAVGNHNGILYEVRYGWQDADKNAEVGADDIYDLASCTKIVSTTLAVMKLYDQGQVKTDERIGTLLPQFASTPVGRLTLRELLTHTSGLGNITLYSLLFTNPNGKSLVSYKPGPDYPLAVDRNTYMCEGSVPNASFVSFDPVEGYRRVGENCYVSPLVDTLLTGEIVRSYSAARRGKYLYSDLNFHLLKLVVEAKSGQSLDQFIAPVYAELSMTSTGYRPLQWKPLANIVPTENDVMMRRGLLRGYTHDEIAAVSDNVGGNAGLFSNTTDLSRFCVMMLGKGTFEDRQIITSPTVNLFTAAPQPLGFNRPQPGGKPNPLAGGYGHTGYTGTIIWIDPSKDLFMVFLSNRVHPSRTNQGLITSLLRAKLWETITAGK